MVRLDGVMREAIIKKYAELTGRSVDEARAILEPLFEDENNELIDMLYKITQLTSNGDGVSKDVAEAVKANMLLQLQKRTTNTNLLDKMQEYIMVMQLLDKMLGSQSKKQDIDPYVKILEERMSNLENTLKQLMETLVKQQQNSTQSELIKTLKMMQDNLQKQIDTLKQELTKRQDRLVITPDRIQEIKQQLEALGFELRKAGSDFDVDKAKEFLKKLGYEVKPGWISADELAKLLEKEREKVKKEIREKILEEVERKKVETAERVVTTAIDKLFDLFSPVIPEIVKVAIGGGDENTKEDYKKGAIAKSVVDEFVKERKGGGGGGGRRKAERKSS